MLNTYIVQNIYVIKFEYADPRILINPFISQPDPWQIYVEYILANLLGGQTAMN